MMYRGCFACGEGIQEEAGQAGPEVGQDILAWNRRVREYSGHAIADGSTTKEGIAREIIWMVGPYSRKECGPGGEISPATSVSHPEPGCE